MLDELTWDFLLRTGVPAGLGVVVVMYLLKVIIPEMQKTFREEMAATRATFEATLRSEQTLHQAMMQQVTQTIQNEGVQTRAALTSLDNSTKALSQTVYKMYGHSMTAFEAAVGSDKRAG
jgi:hypothetical protein